MSATTPKYKHDCNTCRFLGHYVTYDVYVCEGATTFHSSIIARFGDEGPEYASSPLDSAFTHLAANANVACVEEGKEELVSWWDLLRTDRCPRYIHAWMLALSVDWVQAQEEHRHLERKAGHGCTDVRCNECDAEEAADFAVFCSPREWCKKLGGINHTGTKPEDCPVGPAITEEEFWKRHANRNGS